MDDFIEYYILTEDEYLDYGIQGYGNPQTEISFLTGKKIEQEVPLLIFEVDFPSGFSLPHLFTGGTSLVSQEMVHLLEKAGVKNIQTFPVVLHNPTTEESWNDYVILNILGLVEAADLESSEYDVIMEGDEHNLPLLAFNSVCLLRAKLNDLLLFRMAESPATIIIHRKISDLLMSNKPEGGWGIMLTEVTVTERTLNNSLNKT